MTKNEEIEIKMQLDGISAIPRIEEHVAGLCRLGPSVRMHMSAYYYDTAELTLQQHNLVYRVRKENSRCIATIKGKNQGDGFLCRRLEINREVLTVRPELEIFADAAAVKNVISLIRPEQLFPIVTNNFLRQQSLIFYNSSKIEIAIDRGAIRAGNKTCPICEIELELKRGNISDVSELAGIFKDKFALLPSAGSKFSRGLKLTKFI